MRRSRRLFDRSLFVLVLFALPVPALAWKPYTHNTSAFEAYSDATDGTITINGRDYPVLATDLVTALQLYPQFYNAGVIGPDGFPDLTYGQSVIHPGSSMPGAGHTGAWLRLLLAAAQQARSGNDPQKLQILAFTYGFLTHAAGDLWGHTFINDFARGVFPGVGEILTDTDDAGIALRHIVAEGYVGDATPSFDGDRDARTPAPRPPYVAAACPAGDLGCDVSDDSTPGMSYDAPHAFIYDTLIDNAGTPASGRGPLIDFFLELRADLEAFRAADPDPVGDALAAFDDLEAALDQVESDCNFSSVDDAIHDAIACPIALAEFGFDVAIDSANAFAAFASGALEELAQAVLDAYIAAWIDDITAGLQRWSELGLALSKALFDPDTRRALQNDDCASLGDEDGILRANCENAKGMLDVVLDSINPFINAHLLSMMGFPDLVGDIKEAVEDILAVVDDIMATVLGPFNPLRAGLATVTEFIKDGIKAAISEVLGVDIDALQSFLTEPSRWVCLDSTVFDFPQPLGQQTVSLFPAGEHDRLDGLLSLPADHHVPEPSLPDGCGRLEDDAELSFASMAALRNTVTTAKLLLLDGPELNQVLSDLLRGRTIGQYGTGTNLMVQALTQSDEWLRSIDGDHAWREDGLPRFCDQGGDCPGDAETRSAELNGGAGNFPLWESCVLRPAFRQLFVDWEGDGFPDLEDEVSADALNDPQAPASTLALSGTTFPPGADGSGVRTYVAADHLLTQSAHDAPVGLAYQDDELVLRRRVYANNTPPGAFAAVSQNSTLTLAGADGVYVVEYQSADNCHGFDDQPADSEGLQTRTYTLDTAPPVVTCKTPPFALEWDTDDAPPVDYDIDDGIDGSGIASESSTVDGYQGLPGVVPTADGATMDLFFFYPGTRRVVVSSADNLGNAGVTTCSFELHATPESLLSNVNRAETLGLIANHGVAQSLRQKLEQVQRLHGRGQHSTEHNVLQAFVQELLAQRGKKVNAPTADRFIAFALDRISLGR